MTTSNFDPVEWMAAHGRTGYKLRIDAIQAKIDASRSPANIAKWQKDIEEERQAAQDRYDDWATDPDF